MIFARRGVARVHVMHSHEDGKGVAMGWSSRVLVPPAEYFVGAALVAAALIGSRRIVELPRISGAWPRRRGAAGRPALQVISARGAG